MKNFVLLLTLIVCTCACSSSIQAQEKAEAEEQEFSINLKGIDGQKYDIQKMRGNFLLVSFGATWCGPCHEELRDLEILHQEFKDRPIKFLWISVEDKEEAPDDFLKRFAKSLKFTFPILRDPEKKTYKQFSQRVRLPLVVIFDKEGKIVPPNQFGASSQPGYFRIMMRNRLKELFAREEETNAPVDAVLSNLPK